MSDTGSGLFAINEFGPIIFIPNPPDRIEALAQGLIDTGELWSVSEAPFKLFTLGRTFNDLHAGSPPKIRVGLDVGLLERLIGKTLASFIKFAQMMERKWPYVIEVGISGVKGVPVYYHKGNGKGSFSEPFPRDTFSMTAQLDSEGVDNFNAALLPFVQELYQLVYLDRSVIVTDELAARHGMLPAR
jgi:hypothetical protein